MYIQQLNQSNFRVFSLMLNYFNLALTICARMTNRELYQTGFGNVLYSLELFKKPMVNRNFLLTSGIGWVGEEFHVNKANDLREITIESISKNIPVVLTHSSFNTAQKNISNSYIVYGMDKTSNTFICMDQGFDEFFTLENTDENHLAIKQKKSGYGFAQQEVPMQWYSMLEQQGLNIDIHRMVPLKTIHPLESLQQAYDKSVKETLSPNSSGRKEIVDLLEKMDNITQCNSGTPFFGNLQFLKKPIDDSDREAIRNLYEQVSVFFHHFQINKGLYSDQLIAKVFLLMNYFSQLLTISQQPIKKNFHDTLKHIKHQSICSKNEVLKLYDEIAEDWGKELKTNRTASVDIDRTIVLPFAHEKRYSLATIANVTPVSLMNSNLVNLKIPLCSEKIKHSKGLDFYGNGAELRPYEKFTSKIFKLEISNGVLSCMVPDNQEIKVHGKRLFIMGTNIQSIGLQQVMVCIDGVWEERGFGFSQWTQTPLFGERMEITMAYKANGSIGKQLHLNIWSTCMNIDDASAVKFCQNVFGRILELSVEEQAGKN